MLVKYISYSFTSNYKIRNFFVLFGFNLILSFNTRFCFLLAYKKQCQLDLLYCIYINDQIYVGQYAKISHT